VSFSIRKFIGFLRFYVGIKVRKLCKGASEILEFMPNKTRAEGRRQKAKISLKILRIK
jgi:hypothetical protein